MRGRTIDIKRRTAQAGARVGVVRLNGLVKYKTFGIRIVRLEIDRTNRSVGLKNIAVMKTEKLYVIAFSPTGTSRAVASAIASVRGYANTEYIDLGKPGSKPEITLPENAVAVISVPVYGGMAAPVAMERLAV